MKMLKRLFKQRQPERRKQQTTYEPCTPIEIANDFRDYVRSLKRTDGQTVTVKGVLAEEYYNAEAAN